MESREVYRIWDGRHKLANFANTPVGIHRQQDGNFRDVFSSSEQLYQMAKFLPKELEIREAIRLCNDPSESKKITKANKDKIRPDWNDNFKYRVMAGIIRLKIRQNPDAKEDLLGTGNMEICEDADEYASKNPTKIQIEEMRRWGKYKGEGQNWIGKILMDIRTELQQGNII